MHDVSEVLLSRFRRRGRLRSFSSFDDGTDVDSGSTAHQFPQHPREAEHDRLQHENDGHPLVVRDLTVLALVTLGHGVEKRNVVGVVDPAPHVRVGLVVGGALLRAPAVDRLSQVLSSADDRCEDDQQDAGILAVEAIGRIIVVMEFELFEIGERSKYLEHCIYFRVFRNFEEAR